MGQPRELLRRSGGAPVKQALFLLSVLPALAFAAASPAPECDAATLEDLQRRFGNLPASAVLQRDELLVRVAQCRYREARWREFFGLARYRRAFGTDGEAAERLVLLDVLASLRHCRADRAREVFASLATPGAATLSEDRKRIELALGALTKNPETPTKPTEKSTLDRGLSKSSMHWPVSLDDQRLRQSDPFRIQVRVSSRCTVPAEGSK